MDARIALQPAYVLHRIPFQNTSFIVDFFTVDYGRVRAVAKGCAGREVTLALYPTTIPASAY